MMSHCTGIEAQHGIQDPEWPDHIPSNINSRGPGGDRTSELWRGRYLDGWSRAIGGSTPGFDMDLMGPAGVTLVSRRRYPILQGKEE